MQSKQRRKQALDPSAQVKRLREIKSRLRRIPAVESHERAVVVGLLMANVLSPQVRDLYHHWSLRSVVGLPVDAFGKFMARNRYNEILRCLYFCSNEAREDNRDKAWKIPNVIQVLQRTFLQALTMTSRFSFDEGVLPSRSSRNPTRMCMPDKPQRWGTKMFKT